MTIIYNYLKDINLFLKDILMLSQESKDYGLPVGRIKLVTPYPNVKLTSIKKTLADYSEKICVIHLYTG